MTNERDTPLHAATMAQLIEELARRANDNGGRSEPPDTWCDDCVHYRFATPAQAQRRDWNPCARRHAMSFWMPQGHDPDTVGYYVEICADRAPRPAPTNPSPPPAPLEWDHPDYRMDPPARGHRPRPVAPEDASL